MAKPKSDARRVCETLAQQMGYELVDTALDREGSGLYLRVYIDKPGGVTLSDCEAFHRAVQPQLEHVEYDFLEVSSPGIDRPIKTDKDLEAVLGEDVEVRLFRPQMGGKEHRGRLASYDRETVRIASPDGEKEFSRKEVALMTRYIDLSILQGAEADDAGEDEETPMEGDEDTIVTEGPADAGTQG